MRFEVFEKLGEIHKIFVLPETQPVYVEIIGATVKWASALVKTSFICGKVPEPARIARLIAMGVS